jgi:2',3'-cyclic-nucleotide 2'-phosphodiesterase (5'-nucleotidase family)
MKKKFGMRLGLMILILLLVLTACKETPTSTIEATVESTTIPTGAPLTPTEVLSDNLHPITIFYTDDEHGYMEGTVEGLGAAEMVGVWQQEFNFSQDGPFLVLSGGDMWTGPAVSTWFEGVSMVHVMNAMGYHAAAAGNHEFDFGLETLTTNITKMDFPLLSANIRYKSDGTVPTDIGIQPYGLVEVGGVTFGVIGLANTNTPLVTNPDTVASFDFIDYEDALREIVPQVRAAGAQIIVVPTHICRSDLNALAVSVSDLEISMFGGGHCHEHFARKTGEAILLGGGGRLASFSYAHLMYDDETGTITLGDYGMMQNQPGNPDAAVADIVEDWVAEANVVLNQEIGYVNHRITRGGQEMRDLIANTWLWSFPTAEVALSNLGGIRDDIPEGAITVGSIITVMPFDNTIIQLEMTGDQLKNTMSVRGNDLAYAGVKNVSSQWVLSETGEALDPNMSYIVLVNSFIYAGGSGYQFSDYDPNGYDTSVAYRQPLIDWITAQGSSEINPIDDAIDALITSP